MATPLPEPSAMNVFEFIALLLIVGGIVYGIFAASGGGFVAALLGAAKGAAAAFGIYVVMMLGILTLLALALLYRPPFPRCRNGTCTDKDYTYLALGTEKDSPTGDAPGEMRAQCRCGIVYVRGLRHVWEVDEHGTRTPYMYFRPFGRWRADPHRHASDA